MARANATSKAANAPNGILHKTINEMQCVGRQTEFDFRYICLDHGHCCQTSFWFILIAYKEHACRTTATVKNWKLHFRYRTFACSKNLLYYFLKCSSKFKEPKFPFQSVKDKMTSSCLLNKGICTYIVHYDIIKFEFNILPIINACNCNNINSNNFSFLVAKKNPSFQTDNLLSF